MHCIHDMIPVFLSRPNIACNHLDTHVFFYNQDPIHWLIFLASYAIEGSEVKLGKASLKNSDNMVNTLFDTPPKHLR